MIATSALKAREKDTVRRGLRPATVASGFRLALKAEEPGAEAPVNCRQAEARRYGYQNRKGLRTGINHIKYGKRCVGTGIASQT